MIPGHLTQFAVISGLRNHGSRTDILCLLNGVRALSFSCLRAACNVMIELEGKELFLFPSCTKSYT